MENKASFVYELGELLRKYGVENVQALKYEKSKTLEVVTITFCDGYQFGVDVSMDSYAAIVRDVMKTLY